MKKLFSVLTVLLLLIVSTNSAFAALKDGYSLVYRLYNPKTGEHLYTGDGYENDVLGNQGQNKEGAVFISHESGTEAAVYRLRNSKAAEHLYTTDPHEVDVLCDQYGWESDNNGAPVFYDSTPSEGLDSPQADEVGNYVYRLYNSKSGLHLLTNDHNELITLTQGGWNTDDFFGESHMFYAIFPDKAAEAGVMQ